MRKLIVAIFFCTVGIFFTSCKKEKELQNTNTPPVARAGSDQTISLPNSVIIDGAISSAAVIHKCFINLKICLSITKLNHRLKFLL